MTAIATTTIQPDPFAPPSAPSAKRTKPWYLQKRDELRMFRWSLVPVLAHTGRGRDSDIDDPIADRWFR